ncbi:Hypothetical predicted protein, partial [Prunus dulcis]
MERISAKSKETVPPTQIFQASQFLRGALCLPPEDLFQGPEFLELWFQTRSKRWWLLNRSSFPMTSIGDGGGYFGHCSISYSFRFPLLSEPVVISTRWVLACPLHRSHLDTQ